MTTTQGREHALAHALSPPPDRTIPIGRVLETGGLFSMPLDAAVSETFAHLAKRGMGKTHSALVRFEQMVLAGALAVVIDPVGSWWGVRYGKDGSAKGGLPVYILGGDHGDVPLEKTAGAIVAAWVLQARQPVVLDLKHFTDAEVRRFVADFASHLYAHNTSPLHLFLDEADQIVPQELPAKDESDPRLRPIMNHLMRRGRHAGGIGVTLICQRPALLEKNVLTQVECLVVLRMTGPQDQAAIREWIRHHPLPKETVLATLPSLPRGEAWIWSPGWLEFFGRVTIRDRLTFDSGATPVGAPRMPPSGPSPLVDLGRLRREMAETVERAEESDPAALRRRLAEVTAERDRLLRAPPKLPRDLLQKARSAMAHALDEVTEILSSIEPDEGCAPTVPLAPPAVVAAETFFLNETHTSKAKKRRPRPAAPKLQFDAGNVTGYPFPVGPTGPAHDAAPPTVDTKALRILAALKHHGLLAERDLAILSGYVANGGGFRKQMRHLRERGDIQVADGLLSLTEQSRRMPLPPPILGEDLFRFWREQQDEGAKRLLDVLYEFALKEQATNVSHLAERSGFDERGGGFRKHLRNLVHRDLVRKRPHAIVELNPAVRGVVGEGAR